jgi:two-component system, OmpR family, phosphate regulon response regulator PhoB
MIRPRVLVVEDESALAELVAYNLRKSGFDADIAGDGEEALLRVSETLPDLIVLDWMMPQVSGLEVCRRLRRDPASRNVPVIMLTARAEEADRIRGLDVGADDYMVKPFSPAELVARVRAVLRRLRPALAEERLALGDLVLDLAAHRVTRNGRKLELGPTEFRLLRFLLEHPGRVFSRAQLLDAVWGNASEVEERTVDVHIRRLRKAINPDGMPDVIRTVRAAGYAIEATAPADSVA